VSLENFDCYIKSNHSRVHSERIIESPNSPNFILRNMSSIQKKYFGQKQLESKFTIYDSAQSRITRTRPVATCLSCSRRKVKCNRGPRGCSQCIALNITCVYSKPNGSERATPDKTDSTMESQVKKENVEEKEKVLGVLSVDSSTGESRYANMAYWGTMFSEVSHPLRSFAFTLLNS
jgi:hypothetical protein